MVIKMMANHDVHQTSPPGVFASGQLPVGSREKDAMRFCYFLFNFIIIGSHVYMKNKNNNDGDDKYNDDNGSVLVL